MAEQEGRGKQPLDRVVQQTGGKETKELIIGLSPIDSLVKFICIALPLQLQYLSISN